jgi:hypothetical protein
MPDEQGQFSERDFACPQPRDPLGFDRIASYEIQLRRDGRSSPSLIWGSDVRLACSRRVRSGRRKSRSLSRGDSVGFLMFRKAGLQPLRRIAGWSVLPVAVLATLACIPSMNPLWPHAMTELARQESDLQTAIPVGMSLKQVRGVLNSRKIQFYESTEQSDGIVLQYPQERTMTAQSGDVVLVSRFDTEAFEFPCGYDMQIVLVFGHNGNLKERYIHRFRMCP